MKKTVELHCCLCMKTHKTEIELPNGWDLQYDGIDAEDGFCPDHIDVLEFTENCSGCVGGWMDCALWRAFAYSSERSITEADFATIRTGKCPRRTNGTLCFNGETGEMKQIDISGECSSKSGIAFEKAIKDYIEKIPINQRRRNERTKDNNTNNRLPFYFGNNLRISGQANYQEIIRVFALRGRVYLVP